MRERLLEKDANRILLKESDKPSVAVIIRPLVKGDIVGGTLLTNFVQILQPVTSEVLVITGNFPNDFVTGVRVIKVEGNEKIQDNILVRVYKYILLELSVTYSLIKNGKNIQIVILFIGASAYIFPLLAAKLMGKKVAIIVAGSSSKVIALIHQKKFLGGGGMIFSSIFSFIERINHILSDKLIVYSKGLVGTFGLDKYAGKIFTDGSRFVDSKLFNFEDNITEKNNKVGYMGRLTDEKGAMNFIRAIPSIIQNKENVNFIVVGDGWLKSDIEIFQSENNFGDKIEIVDGVLHEEVPSYLKNLKLLVIPSYTEGLPNVMLEAMACGTPVLATPVGAIPDIIKDGETGFIMENNSPECIAENVIRVLEYSNLDEIVKNARKLIEEKYTYEAAVERYGRILENM
jgi:glycosyltransferase involved in cell wall biosynthesis